MSQGHFVFEGCNSHGPNLSAELKRTGKVYYIHAHSTEREGDVLAPRLQRQDGQMIKSNSEYLRCFMLFYFSPIPFTVHCIVY